MRITALHRMGFVFVSIAMMGTLQGVIAPVYADNALREGALGGEQQFGQFLEKFDIAVDDPERQPTDPGAVIQRIVAIVFSFLGIIAVIVMIYAGFLWLTAGGEEEKAKQGRTLLFQAFIGSLIILASYSVVYFVLYMLTLSISP